MALEAGEPEGGRAEGGRVAVGVEEGEDGAHGAEGWAQKKRPLGKRSRVACRGKVERLHHKAPKSATPEGGRIRIEIGVGAERHGRRTRSRAVSQRYVHKRRRVKRGRPLTPASPASASCRQGLARLARFNPDYLELDRVRR